MLTSYYTGAVGSSKSETNKVQTQMLDADLEVYCLSVAHHGYMHEPRLLSSFNVLHV